MLDREGADTAADVMIIGSASEVADRLGELADMGVTDLATVEVAANPRRPRRDPRGAQDDVLTVSGRRGAVVSGAATRGRG